MYFKKLVILIGLFAYAILNGCASFPQNELAEVQQMPNMDRYQNKPSVFVDFKFFQGDPNNSNAVEFRTAMDQLQPAVKQAVIDTKLFNRVTFDEFEKNKVNYTIKLNVYNHGDQGAAAASGFLTGLTLGIIPGAATDNYTLKLQLLDRKGRSLSQLQNKDSIKTWIGLWFIPAMANSPEKALNITLENQIRNALKKLVKTGRMKYSLNELLIVPDHAHLNAVYTPLIKNI